MPRGSRAYHTKSRNGCGQCKKRRVKCDLQPPICKNCKRRGETCDYQLLSSNTLSPKTTKPANTALAFSNANTQLQARQQRYDGAVGILGLRPGATFSLFDDESHIWDASFSQQAQHNAFLQHNVLAIASLHSHLTTTPSPASGNLYAAACAHHLEASRLFRHSVSAVSETNWLSALVFAIGVGIFHFGISKSEPATSVMESMFVLRSAAILAGQVAPWFRASGLQSVIHEKLSGAAVTLDADAALAYQKLAEHNLSLTTDEATRGIYKVAISTLQEWLVMTSGSPRSWFHFIWWPSTLGPEFMALLARREPMALVIFVHWCGVMNKVPRRWFLDGWAVRVATPIIETMDSEWSPALRWPRKALGLQESAGIVELSEGSKA